MVKIAPVLVLPDRHDQITPEQWLIEFNRARSDKRYAGDLPFLRTFDPERFEKETALADARDMESAAAQLVHERRTRIAKVPLRDQVREDVAAGKIARTPGIARLQAWDGDPERRPWIALSGSAGCGKTVAAASLVAASGGDWIRSDDLVRCFASMFGPPLERQEEIKTAKLLVIDDVGSELDGARMLPILLELLDTRMSARWTRTIVTTNLTVEEIRARYQNGRLMSRLSELVHWAALTGDDLRRKPPVA